MNISSALSTTLSLLLAGFILFASPVQAQSQNQEVLDEVAAVVENEIILRSEVNALVSNLLQRSQGRQQFSQDLWMQALNELINQKVMAVEARRDTTMNVTNDQVDQQLDRRIEQMTAQVGGEDRLQQIYGKSALQLKQDLREDFRSQLLAQQLQQRKLQGVNITPSEVQEWFEQIPADSLPQLPDMVRLSHIVRYPKASAAARQEAQRFITSIRDSIVSGEADFEAMARRHSDHAGSATRGGRMQGYGVNDLLPEFSAVASRLSEGEVSAPFETSQGFHIMRLNERRGDIVDFNHILIQVDKSQGGGQRALEHLSAVRDSITAQDVPFEVMVRRHSEEDASANRGGQVVNPQTGNRDLYLDRLGPSWRSTVRNLDEGEISQPKQVQLLSGEQAYHLVKLEEYRPAHRISLESDYDRIKQLALNQKKQRKLQEWLNRLREDLYVDVRVEPKEVAARF